MNQGPFRAPDEVLKLEDQLKDARSEIEDLRRELQEEKQRKEQDPEDARNAREWWTWRLAWVLVATVALSLIWWGYKASMAPESGACREVVLSSFAGEKKCPYGGQIASAVGDRIKCTCPTATPAGSAR